MGEPIVQYGDILTARHLDPAATFKQVWHALNQLTRFDAAVLRHVREDAVANNIGQLASAQVSVHEEAPFVSCDAFSSFAEYDATLSSKKRKNRRRLWNRLNEEATVTTEVVGPGPRALEIMSAGLAHKRHWLDNKAVASTAFADQRLDHLMTAIARGDGPDVGLVAFAIVTNDEIAAVAITFETLGRLNGYMITYAPTHEKHGVGLLNTERMIQGAFDRGAKLFDFMAPSQDYKLAWTNNVVAVNDWVIPKTMRGRILAKAWELRPMLKAQFVRLPSWARRIITAAISRKLTQR
jgi:CelD/BcsL family acetyltransferase involved in cellulose biosynthesis